MEPYEHIPGWFDWEETYRNIVNATSHGIIVEVGCYLGRSLCFLGELVKKSRKPIRVVGVDHCMGSGVENERNHHEEAVQEGNGNFAGKLWNNVRVCGLTDVISLVVADSVKASELFSNDSLACVFIDARHDYLSVKQDIQAWLPKLRMGGIMGGDDMGVPNEPPVWPGVGQAVREMFTEWKHSPHDAWVWTKR